MDQSIIRSLTEKEIAKQYSDYLAEKNLGENTISTITSDTFYLIRHGSNDLFWSVVFSNNFESEARQALTNALENDSNADIPAILPNFVSKLKEYRNFVFEYIIKEPEITDDEALQKLLLDNNWLNQLSKWINPFNIFDVLKLSRVEIRHSNTLAWLLDPDENHGLNDAVLRGFVQYVVSVYGKSINVFKTLLMDCNSFAVYRELHHIDILAISEENKFIFCIENKIDSGKHGDQLKKYKDYINDTYDSSYTKAFLYLTPQGEDPEEDNWYSMSYSDIYNILETATSNKDLSSDVEILIDSYKKIVRREIIMDKKELENTCREIYLQHKKAFDLIYEYKPDRATDIEKIAIEWCRKKTDAGVIQFDEENSTKSYIRFKTAGMSAILPDSPNTYSAWNTKNYYFYELQNTGDSLRLYLVLNSKDIPSNLKDICEIIIKNHPSKQIRTNWQWKNIPYDNVKRCNKKITIGEEKDLTNDSDITSIYKQLDAELEKYLDLEKTINAEFRDDLHQS